MLALNVNQVTMGGGYTLYSQKLQETTNKWIANAHWVLSGARHHKVTLSPYFTSGNWFSLWVWSFLHYLTLPSGRKEIQTQICLTTNPFFLLSLYCSFHLLYCSFSYTTGGGDKIIQFSEKNLVSFVAFSLLQIGSSWIKEFVKC